MAQTPTHKIAYPSGNPAPNVPADMQTMAESTDAALSRISEAPFLVCGKIAQQRVPVAGAWAAVKWDVEEWKQRIGHEPAGNISEQVFISEDGLYSISAKVAYGTWDTTGTAVIEVNGVVLSRSAVAITGTAGTQGTNYNSAPKPTSQIEHRLFAGDVLRVLTRSTRGDVPLYPEECLLTVRKAAGFAKTK